MNNKPCKLTFEDKQYLINRHGEVKEVVSYPLGGDLKEFHFVPVEESIALKVKAEARRLRRNRSLIYLKNVITGRNE